LSYLVLARKYRPRTFEDLVGQPQVRHTLSRALKMGRVAHAYLFTGPRGVGKTTAARLLAMALNCSSETDRPCGECPSCLEIQNGRSVDIMEVDGASNRGIKEIRDLRDTVKFLPAAGRFKVYIIDEVHALTGDAFNALLKTLEEPPGHVVFIFATTEAHKVPATILSRCQRYDFKRIRLEDMVARLAKVSASEGITFETAALTILARQSEGGLRDALGLMDQVIASSGEITAESVNASLGLIGKELVAKLAASCFAGETAPALDAMREAYDSGHDFKELALKVLERVRELTLFKASPGVAEIMDLTDEEEREHRETVKDLSLPTLHRHFESWLKLYGDLARHPHPRWLMEAHVIRLAQMAPLENLANLTARLTALLETSPGSLPALVKAAVTGAANRAPDPAPAAPVAATAPPLPSGTENAPPSPPETASPPAPAATPTAAETPAEIIVPKTPEAPAADPDDPRRGPPPPQAPPEVSEKVAEAAIDDFPDDDGPTPPQSPPDVTEKVAEAAIDDFPDDDGPPPPPEPPRNRTAARD
jgi:DNA polymerase-3 subunit gamma/tau